MMLAAIILVIFNVTFWTLFEQAASSLTLFADRNTTLSIFGFTMSAAATQQFNPIFVVAFAPVLSWVWINLAKRGLEPSIQVKFGIALLLVGLGFVVLAWSGSTANEAFRVSLWWLVLTYFLHSIAELCISPVGLSMITKLSIARIVGMMMGVWFLSISVGEYLAGAAAQAAAVQTVGGQVTNPELALNTYLHTFMLGGRDDDRCGRAAAADRAAAEEADARRRLTGDGAWTRPAGSRSRRSPSSARISRCRIRCAARWSARSASAGS